MQPRLNLRHDPAPAELQALTPDRRSDARFLTVYRLVKVQHAGDEGLGRCRNISDGGARLELHMQLYLGDRISIAFSPLDTVTGRIVWIMGNDYGIEFDEPIDCLSLLGHARDHPHPGRRGWRPIFRQGSPTLAEPAAAWSRTFRCAA